MQASPCQHTVEELIRGVEYPAKVCGVAWTCTCSATLACGSNLSILNVNLQYLGSMPIHLSGIGAIKSARMHQAQQAVKLIKVHKS